MGKSIKTLPFLIVTFFFLNACDNNKIGKISVTDSFPDQIVKNFTMDKYELDKLKWSIFAVRGDVNEKKKLINARDVKVRFYEDNGKVGSIISANKSVIQTDTGDIKAEENVVVFSLLKNTTIFAETLNYFGTTGKVLSDSFIRQEKNDATITGYGLEANADLSEITILRNVKVVKKEMAGQR